MRHCAGTGPLVLNPSRPKPATSKISFNQLNRLTGYRIKYLKVEAETGEEVVSEDIVNAYALDKEALIEATREEFEDLALESTRASRSTSSSRSRKSTHVI